MLRPCCRSSHLLFRSRNPSPLSALEDRAWLRTGPYPPLDRILNGNITIAPTSLKTKSRVKPTIRKGNSMIHISGNRNIANNASGQQRINKINHRRNEMNIFMQQFVALPLAKKLPRTKPAFDKIEWPSRQNPYVIVQRAVQP